MDGSLTFLEVFINGDMKIRDSINSVIPADAKVKLYRINDPSYGFRGTYFMRDLKIS